MFPRSNDLARLSVASPLRKVKDSDDFAEALPPPNSPYRHTMLVKNYSSELGHYGAKTVKLITFYLGIQYGSVLADNNFFVNLHINSPKNSVSKSAPDD